MERETAEGWGGRHSEREGGRKRERGREKGRDMIAASVYDKDSVGPSIRPGCTRCCFTMTNTIQVCNNLITPECLSEILVRMIERTGSGGKLGCWCGAVERDTEGRVVC